MRKKKNSDRRVWLRKLARLHLVLTLISAGTYLTVAFFDPGFLSYDLRQKFHALADDTITVTATVLPAPSKPVPTAVSNCNTNTGVLSVALDWADDTGATSFDIDRDGLPLVTGITSSNYSDTNVALGTTYSYTVTAHGPMGPGTAVSDPVSVTTDADCQVNIVATIDIVTLNGKEVDEYEGDVPVISRARPVFTGTTSIANAIIDIHLYSSQEFFAEITANGNGYWSWQVPSNLKEGSHTFIATATDPNNSSRTATETLYFIRRVASSSGASQSSGGKKETVSVTPASPNGNIPPTMISAPLDFDITLLNSRGEVAQGGEVLASLRITKLDPGLEKRSFPIRFSLIDEKGVAVLSVTRETLLEKGKTLQENFPVPLYWQPGNYRLLAEILLDKDIIVSRSIPFLLIELPLLQFGPDQSLSYAETMENLSWVLLALITLFLAWFFLFIREYWLALKADRTVTEQDLDRAGFFS